ncbi:MAG: rhodanese-related sulfurtransferase [Bacteroidetes bacterium]|jgi:UPF0176 protein|nr:rhodanese-related sulfurtransferase [Bacteroidota bacterium]
MSVLVNRVSRQEMRKRLMEEPFRRITLSFYRYVILDDPQAMRDALWKEWSAMNVFGRIYAAREGINAQLSVPEFHFDAFRKAIDARPEFKDVPFKIAVEDDGKSFFRLTIKVRKKIVADGLADDTFDVTNVGNHLSAAEFNAALEQPETIVVDMRNHYESEVGRFEGAILPEADTFKEELPMVLDKLKGQEDKKILMYCTGGVRCEKASAWLKHHGFKDVNQLYGGIIEYARQVKTNQLPTKFIGKNFVFDERLGERITNDILAQCHNCGTPADDHLNCTNQDCHVLYILCPNCIEETKGYCSPECKAWDELTTDEKKQRRAEGKVVRAGSFYHSKLKPAFTRRKSD